MSELKISTERLFLRGIRMSDAESMFKYRSNPKIYKFQSWKPQSLHDVKDFISNKISKEPDRPGTWFQMGIFIKNKEEMIGDLGINFISDGRQCEIGYTLALEYQGKGYATEALEAVIDYLFHNLNKHRIIASVDPRNEKSIKLLERIGMRKEAHFKKSVFMNEEWTDDLIYAILNEEWI